MGYRAYHKALRNVKFCAAYKNMINITPKNGNILHNFGQI